LTDLLAAAQEADSSTRRRKLQDEELSLEDIRALLETANEAHGAAYAIALLAAAEAAALAAEIAAALSAVNTAYTTKPVIEGAVSLED
jgi:hypothetical protein